MAIFNPTNYAAPSALNASDRHPMWSGADANNRHVEYLWGVERSSDPADPPEGMHVIWQSDGTGTGSDGDIMIKVTAGAVTKTATLIDFSVLS